MRTILGFPGGTTIPDLKEMANKVGLHLNGVFLKDMLEDEHPRQGAYIINMDSFVDSISNGSHWVAVYLRKDSCLYFDSFAVAPPIEVVEFCKRWKRPIIYNNKKEIQAIEEGFCGQFTVLFLKYVAQRKKQNGKVIFTTFLKNFVDNI